MIFSVNPKPSLTEFADLMRKTDILLNDDAAQRPAYYAGRSGNLLEDDVTSALMECAKGTPFDGTIEKISGQRFPDIVAAKFYGVEVKSTKDDHWTSTGSSILETTRIGDVERIYMTFGKLGGTPRFLSRPYEQCLGGIAVTHMPRYLIDMRLKAGETIFDKMGIAYDVLRKMDDPISPVAQYYKSQLKPGESLWWVGNPMDEAVSATIKLWKNLSAEQKRTFKVYACVNFPEIFGGDYGRYALWLTAQGVADPHIRDQFSAGGQENMRLSSGAVAKLPAIFRRVKQYADLIVRRFSQAEPIELVAAHFVDGSVARERLRKWAEEVARYSPTGHAVALDALGTLFGL